MSDIRELSFFAGGGHLLVGGWLVSFVTFVTQERGRATALVFSPGLDTRINALSLYNLTKGVPDPLLPDVKAEARIN